MSRTLRVLLVEDNPGDADLTKELLEGRKRRLEVALAVNGAEAMELLQHALGRGSSQLPDLVLLDLNLPKLDGWQVLTQIKTHETLRRIPVVVLTSSDAPHDITRSYELGANCYVTKPVGLEACASIMRSIETFWLGVVKLP